MRRTLPPKGRSRADVIAAMRAMKEGDADWQHGRVPLFVFKATDELSEVGRDAFMEFFSENALGGKRAFPSVKQMEDEVVEIALDLFHAPDDAQGFMSTGGTESIVQAVQTCRDWNRKRRGDPQHRGNLVLPESVHPAFNKGAKLMDLEVRRVPVGADFRADVAALDAAIDADTIMLVGSAPNFPYGGIDPIAELGQLAEKRDVWLHVDACVGGYLAPFVRMNGADIAPFDFALPGVRSMSADLHKYGYAAKGASTVFFRSAELQKFMTFDFRDWPGGRMVTPTLAGTRPGGAISAAWAVMNVLGVAGYRDKQGQVTAARERIEAGVRDLGFEVLGRPQLGLMAFTHPQADALALWSKLRERGWFTSVTTEPKSLHLMLSPFHLQVTGAYLADLAWALGEVSGQAPAQGVEARYS
jgi:glutamate/tyrosine decarboxylase-like PLP-dependent enzyme